MLTRPEARAYHTFEGCAVPEDSATAFDRLHPRAAKLAWWVRRKLPNTEQRLTIWPWALALVALLLLALNDVRWRDRQADLHTHYQAEIERRDREIAFRRGEPQAQRCEQYSVWMEGTSVTHCSKPAIRM